MKIISNALIWLFFVCVVGLAQIGIAFWCSIVKGSQISNLDRFYYDGFFLFFSISLIAGIIYEFQFENKCKINKTLKNALLGFSAIIGLVAMLTYAIAFASKLDPKTNMNVYIATQNYLTIATVFVSLTMKYFIYSSK